MVDKEFAVTYALYFIAALLICVIGQAWHLTGILAWLVLVVVVPPMLVLLVNRWLPDWFYILGAYWAMAVCVIAGGLSLVLASISAIRWLGLL
jgi:hypothetical protein